MYIYIYRVVMTEYTFKNISTTVFFNLFTLNTMYMEIYMYIYIYYLYILFIYYINIIYYIYFILYILFIYILFIYININFKKMYLAFRQILTKILPTACIFRSTITTSLNKLGEIRSIKSIQNSAQQDQKSNM